MTLVKAVGQWQRKRMKQILQFLQWNEPNFLFPHRLSTSREHLHPDCLGCYGIRNNWKRRRGKESLEQHPWLGRAPGCGPHQICSNSKASFIAKAIGFPVTLDFQNPLQAQSCWYPQRTGFVSVSNHPSTPLYFLHPMTVLLTKQTEIIHRGGHM